jgi:hypothetical protein
LRRRGHFARSNITLTDGMYVGAGDTAGEQVIDGWEAISDPTGEIVPDPQLHAGRREVARAATAAQAAATAGRG